MGNTSGWDMTLVGTWPQKGRGAKSLLTTYYLACGFRIVPPLDLIKWTFSRRPELSTPATSAISATSLARLGIPLSFLIASLLVRWQSS